MTHCQEALPGHQQSVQQADTLAGGQPGTCAACLSPSVLQGVEVVEYVLGDLTAPDDVGQQLFAALRMMDTLKVDAIVVEGVLEQDAGSAVMNRLRKASTTVVHLRQ